MRCRTLWFHQHILGIWLCVWVLLTGCNTNSAPPQVVPTCNAPANQDDPYDSHSLTSVSSIYAEYRDGYYSGDSRYRDSIKQKAFMLLGKYTERWSDFEDFSADGLQVIRVTVTYIHPSLIHHIVLNNTISNNLYIEVSEFERELGMVMNRLGGYNELLFWITITATTYNRPTSSEAYLTITLPIWDMDLVNSSGAHISPLHVDPVLGDQVMVVREPVFGFVSFPMSVANSGSCLSVMDSLTTTMGLEISNIKVGEKLFSETYWSVPYRSSVFGDLNLPVLSVNPPAHSYEANYDWGRVGRLQMPPAPNGLSDPSADPASWKRYWEDMGRYLWYQLLPENEP